MTKKTEEIVKSIEEGFRALAEEIGETHVSGFLLDGVFCIHTYCDNESSKLDYYSKGRKNNE